MSLRSILVFIAVVTLLSSPLLIAHGVWRLSPVLQLKLKLVDYSVPNTTYRSHIGLCWLLNHRRIVEPEHGGQWRADRDYVGFDPRGPGKGTRLSQINLDGVRWLYLSDTYGVHTNDRKDTRPDPITDGFIFGGLSLEDAAALRDFADGGGGIVSEFNSLADPTPPPARDILSSVMGVEQRGWTGRFVAEFQKVKDEFRWFDALYKTNFEERPLPRGPGLMLIHEDGRMVLLSGALFEESMPSISLTAKGKEWMGMPVGAPPYYGWFGVVSAAPGTTVLAEMILPTPEDWKKTLYRNGLPTHFAVLTRKRVGTSERFYIAADISLMDEVPKTYSLAFLPRMLAAVHRRRDSLQYSPTFWQFFVPVVGKILTDAAYEGNGEGRANNDV